METSRPVLSFVRESSRVRGFRAEEETFFVSFVPATAQPSIRRLADTGAWRRRALRVASWMRGHVSVSEPGDLR